MKGSATEEHRPVSFGVSGETGERARLKMNMNERELGRPVGTETCGGRCDNWRSCRVLGGWSEASAKEGTRFGWREGGR